MGDTRLPSDVADFVSAHITSALQLEVLLLLQSHPEQQWKASEIDAQLRISPAWVASQLDELCKQGLLTCIPGNPQTYQYAPANAALSSGVALLAKWYATHRVAIISVIYSPPTDNLRTFADAFRFRKENPNG